MKWSKQKCGLSRNVVNRDGKKLQWLIDVVQLIIVKVIIKKCGEQKRVKMMFNRIGWSNYESGKKERCKQEWSNVEGGQHKMVKMMFNRFRTLKMWSTEKLLKS